MMQCVQYIFLAVMIAAIWALLSMPIVFYHLPINLQIEDTTNKSAAVGPTNNTSSNRSSSVLSPGHLADVCPTPVPYTGSVCSDVLQQYSDCLPGNTRNSTIILSQDRTEIENKVASRLELVEFFAYTKECIRVARPLICAFYFSEMCDSQGKAHRLSKQQCVEASQGVCKKEWKMASGYVPDCNGNLFTSDSQLTTTCSHSHSHSVSKTVNTVKKVDRNCSLNCSLDFHCFPGSSGCTPTCDWLENEEPANTIINVCVMVSCIMGLIFAILTLITAAIKRDTMCHFPSVIIVYQTVAAFIIALFVLIGFTNQKALYCWSDNDLTHSVRHTTPFCIVSGMATHYFLMFLSLWWICHIAIIYWKLQFPFHARSWEMEGKVKYVHLTCVILVVLLSFVPLMVIMIVDWRLRASGEVLMGTLGFGKTRFHPLMCSATNRKSVYYSLILPINLLVPVGVTLLILSVWVIHKNYQRNKETKEKQKFKLSIAECKILLIVCYYVMVTVVAMIALTIISWKATAFVKALFAYFLCQRSGYNPSQPCSRDQLNKLHQTGLIAIAFISVGLLPLVSFIFTTDFKQIATVVCKCCRPSKGVEPVKGGEGQSLIKADKQPNKATSDTEYTTEHED